MKKMTVSHEKRASKLSKPLQDWKETRVQLDGRDRLVSQEIKERSERGPFAEGWASIPLSEGGRKTHEITEPGGKKARVEGPKWEKKGDYLGKSISYSKREKNKGQSSKKKDNLSLLFRGKRIASYSSGRGGTMLSFI